MLILQCECGQEVKAAERMRGQFILCPACGRELMVASPGDGFANLTRADLEKLESPVEDDDEDTYELRAPEATDSPDGWKPGRTLPAFLTDDAPPAPEVEKPSPRKGKSVLIERFIPAETEDQPPKRKAPKPKAPPPATLTGVWQQSFLLPIQGEGRWIILVWAAMYASVSFIYWLVGPLALILFIPLILAMCAYGGSYLVQVLRSAAQGEEDLPHSTAGESIAGDLAIWIACLLAGFGPLLSLLVRYWQGQYPSSLAYWACVAFGACYTPMALIAATMSDSILGLSPHVTLPAIRRFARDYFATCGVIVGTIVLSGFIGVLREIPLVMPFLRTSLILYVAIVSMHMLGAVYYRNRDRIGWFRSGDNVEAEIAANSGVPEPPRPPLGES